jgi:hypothetical protein
LKYSKRLLQDVQKRVEIFNEVLTGQAYILDATDRAAIDESPGSILPRIAQ